LSRLNIQTKNKMKHTINGGRVRFTTSVGAINYIPFRNSKETWGQLPFNNQQATKSIIPFLKEKETLGQVSVSQLSGTKYIIPFMEGFG